MGLQRVGHNRATNTVTLGVCHVPLVVSSFPDFLDPCSLGWVSVHLKNSFRIYGLISVRRDIHRGCTDDSQHHVCLAIPRSPGVHTDSQHPPPPQMFGSLNGSNPDSCHWQAPLGSLAASPCSCVPAHCHPDAHHESPRVRNCSDMSVC